MSANWLDIYGQLDSRGMWLAAPWPQRLVVSGPDCRSFLQNFCTNDVVAPPAGSVVEAFFLNAKGHILTHGILSLNEHEAVIYPVGQGGADLVHHLTRYVIREKVDIEVIDAPWWLAIGGAAPATATIGTGPTEGLALADCHVIPLPLLHLNAWIVETSLVPEHLEIRLEEAGFFRPPVESVGTVVFDSLRIESGLPLPEIDYPPGTLPQELDRSQHAIHFGKGCYLGQETVARLDALGHVNKVLRGIVFAEDSYPYPGIEVLSGARVVGTVTSITYSPLLKTSLGLAIVRREAAEVGTEVTWSNGTAKVVALPIAALKASTH